MAVGDTSTLARLRRAPPRVLYMAAVVWVLLVVERRAWLGAVAGWLSVTLNFWLRRTREATPASSSARPAVRSAERVKSMIEQAGATASIQQSRTAADTAEGYS